MIFIRKLNWKLNYQKANLHQKVYHYLNHHKEYHDNDPLINHPPGQPQHRRLQRRQLSTT